MNIGNGADIKKKNLAKLIFSLTKPKSNLYIGKLKSRITDIKKHCGRPNWVGYLVCSDVLRL